MIAFFALRIVMQIKSDALRARHMSRLLLGIEMGV
jgi:hypothetical protein